MNAHRNRSLCFWLAALAILWGALAPSFAASAAHHGANIWAGVCMQGAVRLVALGADGAPDSHALHPGVQCAAGMAHDCQAVAAHPSATLAQSGATGERSCGSHHELSMPHPASDRTVHRSRAPPTAS